MLHAYCPHSREGSARSPHMSTRDAASNLPGPSAATSAPPAPAPRDGAPARGVAAPRPPADPRRTHFPPAAGRRPVAPVPGEGARPATRCGVHHLSHTHVARLRTRAPLRSNTPRCADTACHHPTPRNTERGARGPAGRRSPGSRRPPPSERGDARPGRLCVGRTKARHSAFPATPAPPLRAALPAHHPTYPGRWSSVEWGCHSAASGAACCSAPHSKNGGGGRVGWPGPPAVMRGRRADVAAARGSAAVRRAESDLIRPRDNALLGRALLGRAARPAAQNPRRGLGRGVTHSKSGSLFLARAVVWGARGGRCGAPAAPHPP